MKHPSIGETLRMLATKGKCKFRIMFRLVALVVSSLLFSFFIAVILLADSYQAKEEGRLEVEQHLQ